MASRAFGTFARSAARQARAQAAPLGRRMMSAEAHAKKPKSDTPWIISSIVVFGVPLVYLLGPGSEKDAHHAAEHHLATAHKDETNEFSEQAKEETKEEHEPVLMTDDEGKKEDVSETMATAESTDAPKAADSDETPGSTSPEPAKVIMTDDEGTEQDVSAEMASSEVEDSPKAEQSSVGDKESEKQAEK